MIILIKWLLTNFCIIYAESKWFKPDLRVMHVRDLNFVLRSEIFVHLDGQLQASHLILGVNPVYSTWQTFSQALLVDSPLLSYIDVRHANFLPLQLTVGEARDLDPQYIASNKLAPMRNASTELVSQNHRVHVSIKPEVPVEPEAPAQVAEPIKVESVNSSGTEPNLSDEMVTRQTMTIGCFVPDARPAPQQPEPRG